jgi:Na+-driven multidrug efflux pump
MTEIIDKEAEIKKLVLERDKHVTRIFWILIEIAFIFGIPAAIAVVLIKTLGGNTIYIALPTAFVISWVVLIIHFRKLHKKLKGLDDKIKELKS